MSDRNNINDFDLMMKSILDGAREEVPERVWEGVSAGLDKAARRRTVVLWWRRAAAGVAVAAVLALGVFFTYDNGGNEFVPAAAERDMIAVVEDAVEDGQETVLVAEAEEAAVQEGRRPAAGYVPESAADAIEASEKAEETFIEEEAAPAETDSEKRKEIKEETSEENVEVVYFPEDWGDDEDDERRKVALVFSGVAGTNNSSNQDKFAPMKRPVTGSFTAPKETGIEETSSKSAYGVPVSFGAGIKFEVAPRWSIGAGLNYTYLTRQFYGKYTKVADDGHIEKITMSDIRNRQHYIGIPVNVFYDVISNDKIDFYAYAGGTAEKCVSNSYSLLSTTIRYKEEVKGIQLSVNAGIGVEFILGENLGFYIDPSIRYYFRNEKQPLNIRTVQPLMLGFEMGLRARL